jgi:predicted glycoside hydrolase/deacetylase ChbG (UPF0249 family)
MTRPLTAERNLIVNADDLGLSAAVNAGIFEAHERGIVTSSSLMVRQGAAEAAARTAAASGRLAIGLHLDLGQWDYEAGEWVEAYLRCDTDDPLATEAECRAQLERFRALVGRDPTHLDSHQHLHESEPLAAIAAALATELRVPLRNRRIRYEGSFYGQSGRGEPYPQGITAAHLAELIRSLPPGWTEIGCHPAAGPVTSSSYGHEREAELRALCDPRMPEVLSEGRVGLRSFAEARIAGLPEGR